MTFLIIATPIAWIAVWAIIAGWAEPRPYERDMDRQSLIRYDNRFN